MEKTHLIKLVVTHAQPTQICMIHLYFLQLTPELAFSQLVDKPYR